MTPDAKAAVLDYLEQAAGTRTSIQIGRAARLRPHEVAAVCLELQREGLVERRHTGWKAKARGTTPTTASGAEPESPMAVPDPASRWIDFRRLCLYYAECLRVEERPRIAAFADKAGTAFYQLDHRVDGRALAAGQPLNISLDDDLRRFVRSSSILRQFKTVYVGAPVDVLQGGGGQDAYTLITPVVVVPTVARLGDRYLELVPSGSVEINYGWLEKRVRREADRRQLLQELGLDVADFDADGAGHLRVDSLEAVARELFLVKRDWFRESPETGRPSTSPTFKDLDPGIYNRFVLMEAPKLQYAHRVVGELHEIALKALDEELDQTALSHVFPHRAPVRADVVDDDDTFSEVELTVPADPDDSVVPEPPAREFDEQSIAELALLNQDQLDACRSALTQPVTVITGPPGTGKSMVVRHVLANMAVRRRSVVFASRNHQALEAVEPWLNQQVSPDQLVLRPVYRYGEQVKSFQWMRALTELLATPTHMDERDSAGDATEQLLELLGQRRIAESGIEKIFELQERLADLETLIASELVQLDGRWQELAWTRRGLPAREALERLGEFVQRAAAARSWWRLLLDRLLGRDSWKQVVLTHQAIVAEIPADVVEAVPQTLRSAPCEHPQQAALRESVAEMLRIVDVNQKAAQVLEIRAQIESMPPRSSLSDELSELVGPSHEAFRGLLSVRAKSFGSEISNEARVAFANLRSAMRNRPEELEGDPERSKFGREFRKWLPELLRHFPLWALPNLSVGKAVPLAPAVFDLVVIDESSQCDIATIVPLLYRAERCVIVGDPNQLTHLTRMGRGVEMKIREQQGVADYEFERFTFVTNSCFDLVANSPDRSSVFLANHYRCHPDIVGYCNDAGFYNGGLRVCTDVDRLQIAFGHWKARRACAWQDVVGGIESASSGCMCRAEIDAIVAALVELESEGFVGTVGVVTPFRKHADRINDAVSSRFGSRLPATWKLQVHTADGFQGDERDIILFSLCGGPDMPGGSRGFLAGDANRFNVAVSRARSVLRVFGNLEWAKDCGIGHIQALAERCIAAAGGGRSVRTDLIGPVWEPRLAEALRAVGIDFEQQYLTCGFYLDFAIVRDDVRIDIEVDGETYHRSAGGGRRIEDLYRDHLLIAAGWKVLRFWVYELREDLDECIRRIQQAIADRAGQRSESAVDRGSDGA